MYRDLGCIRVDETYIPLVEDIPIASIDRLNHKTKILQQTAHIRQCQIRKHINLPTDYEYEISPFEIGQIGSEPSLIMMNSISKLSEKRRLPVMHANTTNQTLYFKAGTPVARIRQISSTEITSIDKIFLGKPISVENLGGSDKICTNDR